MQNSLKLVVFCVCLLIASVYGKPNEDIEKKNLVSTQCLNCICFASSGCNLKPRCDGNVCGPYRISLGYWLDAGRPTVKENYIDSKNVKGDDTLIETYTDKEYRDCANNYKCASRAVEGYMQRYASDCDGDKKINCDDYARIHRLGPEACSQNLDTRFEKAYKKCINNNA